jgi:catechol 2,3-dioxygenase-like lactoylglutathione lyase family enzyme
MTPTPLPTTDAYTASWQGINHLALVTADMDATVRFYHGTLGARLVSTIATATFRHYFFEFGPHCTVAFFQYADTAIEPFAKPAGVPDSRAPQFDHLAINVPDEEALHALQRRLKTSHCEVTDVIDHGAVRSVYFTDPNGIALEASWWVYDPTGQPADYHDPQQFADPDPVAAVVELQTTGTLTDIQDSRLAPTA